MSKVTRAEALRRFVDERVQGDAPMAVNALGKCVYSHDVNGGCAVGCLLPAEVAAAIPQDQFVSGLNVRGACEDYLEDAGSLFWQYLQEAHDHLAKFVQGHSSGLHQSHYQLFERGLHGACQQVD